MLRLIAIIDGVWFAFSACVLVVFGRYIALEIAAARKKKLHGIENGHHARTSAAMAMCAYFVGETMWRGLVWWSRTHQDFDNAWASAMFVLAGCIAVAGAMACVRMFTPPQCGPRSWMAALAAALILSAVSVYIT